MPLNGSLFVTDAGDGQTAQVSLVGWGTQSVRLYYASFTGGQQGYNWILLTTQAVTNSLAFNVTVASGYYVWLAVGVTTGDVSNAYFRSIASLTAAPHYRVLLAFQNRVRQIGLSEIPDANVVVRWVPQRLAGDSGQKDPVPLCVIAPPGEEQTPDGTAGQDDHGYPVIVGFFDDLNNDEQRRLAQAMKWRNQVSKALNNAVLDEVDENYIVVQEDAPVLDLPAYVRKHLVTYLVFKVMTREGRGLGA